MRIIYTIFNILRFNRQNWKAVALCIIAATVFWVFNALNKTYTTNISFPLTFDYDNENFIPVGSLPQSVRLNVTGNGWELFKRSTGVKPDPLEIPLERPGEVKKIVGSGLKFSFSNQLAGLEINHVLSDTIYLDLEPRIGRWIQVDVDSLQYNMKRNYGLTSEVVIKPDSIYVEGPKRIVERIRQPFKLALPHRNIDDDYREEISVELPHRDVLKIDPAVVAVEFDVDEMIIVRDSVRLKIVNIPPTVSDVSTTKVPVVISVPEQFREAMKTDSLRAEVDLRNFRRGTRKVLPTIKGLPPYSIVVKVDSVIVSL
jgi:hypothetical protein